MALGQSSFGNDNELTLSGGALPYAESPSAQLLRAAGSSLLSNAQACAVVVVRLGRALISSSPGVGRSPSTCPRVSLTQGVCHV